MAQIFFPTKSGQAFTINQVPVSGDSHLVSQIIESNEKDSVIAIICRSAQDGLRLRDELQLFAPTTSVHYLPSWEILPYDHFSPHHDLISERIATLYDLHRGHARVLITDIRTALQRLCPPQHILSQTFAFRKGQTIDPHTLREQLQLTGYAAVSNVYGPGEYSVRGGLIDLYPMGSKLPYRIDLFDNEIESIRAFDPDTQKSLYPITYIRLLPAREFPFDESARSLFRSQWRECFEGDPTQYQHYKDVGAGIATAGIEFYLPLFFEKTATLFEYLPRQTQLLLHGDLDSAIQQFFAETQARYEFLQHDTERRLLPPKQLFIDSAEFFGHALRLPQLKINVSDKQHNAPIYASALTLPTKQSRDHQPLAHLKALLKQPIAPIICVDSLGRREIIVSMLRDSGIPTQTVENLPIAIESVNPEVITLVAAPIAQGFVWIEKNIAFITESEMFGQANERRRTNRSKAQPNLDLMIRDLAELKVGDPVTHEVYGVGRYQGLTHLEIANQHEEFVHLTYANNGVLYVPVAELSLLSRYSSIDNEHAPLHSLGSNQWEKAKNKAIKQIRDTAADLLNLYAQRAQRQGYSYTIQTSDYEEFVAGFGFEETIDQQTAIEAVIQDMTSAKPMDRLVCGDVGFGKTEIALRAAFIAVMAGKQVAVMAPTTLLVEQHFQTFSNRFANWPVRIAELSRFKSPKENKAAIDALKEGQIDIVIATHRLLSSDIAFKNLGLVIIDEEHRFGVRQKERLKALRSEVDILTLTATPIPRTLGMALEGIRDLSVISTAPQKRLAIKTFLRQEDKTIIREAILREMQRGGQIYFVHNDIITIHQRRQVIQELVPEAQIIIGHGQMPERELEQVMRQFVQGKAHILLCTTIIETGINVPNANTIIIDRADQFGLAQLHQLRGRVGRSHHQAYAYLLVPNLKALSQQANRRLDAIQQMEELGSGFFLAMHDMEIRGVGEILGDKQSGDMREIGFQLYADMLQHTIKQMQLGKIPQLDQPLHTTVDINLSASAVLPKEFCPDVPIRLSLYQRLALAQNTDDVLDIKEEIVDRFGTLPDPANCLIHSHLLRVQALPLRIQKIQATEKSIKLDFHADAPIDPGKLILWIQSDKHLKLSGPTQVTIHRYLATWLERYENSLHVLRTIKERVVKPGHFG